MKAWEWVEEHFGTPQTGGDWIYFLILYVVIPAVVLWILKITL